MFDGFEAGGWGNRQGAEPVLVPVCRVWSGSAPVLRRSGTGAAHLVLR